jgi:fatty-acyl-CoA synthase
MYIGDYLARRELYSPDRLAFVDYGKQPALRFTYAQANQRANRLANYFKGNGIQKGDRVASWP